MGHVHHYADYGKSFLFNHQWKKQQDYGIKIALDTISDIQWRFHRSIIWLGFHNYFKCSKQKHGACRRLMQNWASTWPCHLAFWRSWCAHFKKCCNYTPTKEHHTDFSWMVHSLFTLFMNKCHMGASQKKKQILVPVVHFDGIITSHKQTRKSNFTLSGDIIESSSAPAWFFISIVELPIRYVSL